MLARYVGKLPLENQCTDKQVRIKSIVLINLNDGAHKNEKLNSLSALHTLYPYFIDTERADVLIEGGRVVLDGTVPLANKETISNNLGKCLAHTPTYHISGSLEFITDAVSSLAAQDLNVLPKPKV